MVIKAFQNQFPHRLRHTYFDNPSSEFLNEEHKRLLRLKAELNYQDMIIMCTQDGFEFGFNSLSEKTRFERLAFNPINKTGSQVHTENFVYHDPEYIQAWAESVQEIARQHGAHCEIEIVDNNVIVKLDSIEDFEEFLNARDDGYFDDLAHQKIARRAISRHLNN